MNEHNISASLIMASHENLKKRIAQLKSFEDMENAPEDAFNRVFYELYHSNLIAAGDIRGDEANVAVACGGNMRWMALYTDMDEFRKVYPKLDVSAHQHTFQQYVKYLIDWDLSGLIINIRGDYFALPTDIFKEIDYPLVYDFPTDNSYACDELNFPVFEKTGIRKPKKRYIFLGDIFYCTVVPTIFNPSLRMFIAAFWSRS